MSATEARFAFHRSLYLKDALLAAIELYRPYTTSIDVEETESDTIVTLRGYDPDYGDALGDNFANHALFESVVRTRQTLAGVPL